MLRARFLYIVIIYLFTFNQVFAACTGRIINPITDICWSCIFPLSIGGISVNSGGRADTSNPTSPVCLCPKPPLPLPVPGLTVGFWEPISLVEVTKEPFCMVNMGGLSLGGKGLKFKGSNHGSNNDAGLKRSFYHIHYYKYPAIYWLELITDFVCLQKGSYDLAYMSEFDPTWNDDELVFLLNPEAILFANPVAQGACAVDCALRTARISADKIFWCGGCQGSLFPLSGNNSNHAGGVQASLLLTQRLVAKMHKVFMLPDTSSPAAMCMPLQAPYLKKSQYRIQMTYPIPTTIGIESCIPMGATDVFFGAGREFPIKGEDFGYLIWRKKNCCAL